MPFKMKTSENVDWVASGRISNIIDARLGECLTNAVRAFLDFPESLPSDATFIEGFYIYGGQFMAHTWIETSNKIIDLSLVNDLNTDLRNNVKYYPIQQRSIYEIQKLYGDRPRKPGERMLMKLGRDDPRVVKLEAEVDRP